MYFGVGIFAELVELEGVSMCSGVFDTGIFVFFYFFKSEYNGGSMCSGALAMESLLI